MRFSARLFLLGALLLLWGSAAEARMVSIDRDTVNIRSGPSTNYSVKWEVGLGFPLKIIASKGSWYKVRDFENDEGWVYAPLTSRKAHLVVKKPVVNIRSGPGTNYRIVTQAKYGVVFRTEKRVKGWVRVRHESGVTGWVARRLLWGW